MAEGHHHGSSAGDADRRWMALALAIIVAFMGVEIVAGIVADSLALLSDAAHMLTDAAAIALAIFAARLAARPPSRGFTFGLGRAEILSAQVNGAALLVLAGVIALEGARRLSAPPDVEGIVVVIVGLAGAVANLGAAWAISRSERRSLNVEGALAHVLADLYGSAAAVIAGLAVLTTGFDEADGLAALVVAGLMVRSGWHLLRESARVLLEGAPGGVDPDAVGRALAGHPGVIEVHDLHVWEVTSGFSALSAHVLVPPGDDCHQRRRELAQLLAERFDIGHATLQVDHERGRQLLQVEGAEGTSRIGGQA